MSSTWAAAAVPGPVYVGGQKLKALTYGHAVLLERVGISEILTPLEFWGFVGICQRDFKSGCNWLDWFLSPLGQWYYTRKPMPKNRTKALAEALVYIQSNMQLPELLEVEGKGHATGAKYGAPVLQTLRTVALSKLNYTPSEMMDSGLLQLMWDCLAYNEQHGGAKIIDGQLAAGIAELERLQAERQKANA
jgi:hypothetical protein